MTAPDGLYAPLFGDSGVAECFTDRARLQAMLDVELALAEAEAQVGAIPHDCLPAIREAAHAGLYDRAALADEAARAGNLAIPLVEHLSQRVASIDRVASRYVHWGATSQDILDTALVLQLRAARPLFVAHLERAAEGAAALARRYKETPIAGRTWLQHATPTTFGLKAAGWCAAIERGHTLVGEAFDRALILQFGGASGTLAALGPRALDVAQALASRLNLPVPAAPWHAHRDRIAQLACALGVVTGTLGKIARDLSLLAQTEVGEAVTARAGGSSTMPHKRNPVGSAVAIAAATRVPGLVSTMLSAMLQEHERGLGGWPAEWDVMPEIVLLAAGAARACANDVESLVIDPARMRQNLDLTHGAAQAEAIVMALAPHMGKREAHAIVEDACRRATSEGRLLVDVLADVEAVTRVVAREALVRCVSPEAYLGAAEAFVTRLLDEAGRSDEAHAMKSKVTDGR